MSEVLKSILVSEFRRLVKEIGGVGVASKRLGCGKSYVYQVMQGKVSFGRLLELLKKLGWDKEDSLLENIRYETIISEYSLKHYLISCILVRMQEMRLSKSKLADSLGISRSRIQQILKGNCSINKLLETIEGLGGKVKASVSWS